MYVFSVGVASLIATDSAIFLSASSMHLRMILTASVVSVALSCGCLSAKWSPSGVSAVLLVASLRCSL